MKKVNKILIIIFLIFFGFILWTIIGPETNNLWKVVSLIAFYLVATIFIEFIYKKVLVKKNISDLKIVIAIIIFFFLVVLITKLISLFLY